MKSWTLHEIFKRAIPALGWLFFVPALCSPLSGVSAESGALPAFELPDHHWGVLRKSLASKDGEGRERLLSILMDGDDPEMAKAAGRELLGAEPLARKLIRGIGVPVRRAQRLRALEAYLRLGGLAEEELGEGLSAEDSEALALLKGEMGDLEHGNAWELVRVDGDLRVYEWKHPGSECPGSTLFFRKGARWLEVDGRAGLALLEPCSWGHLFGAYGRGVRFWPMEGGAWRVYASIGGFEVPGHLLELAPTQEGYRSEELARLLPPVVGQGNRVYHGVTGSTDVWVFDPVSETSSLFFKGPGIEPYYHGPEQEGAAGRPSTLKVEDAPDGVSIWGLPLDTLAAAPRWEDAPGRTASPEEWAVVLEAAGQICRLNDVAYAGEGLAGLSFKDWRFEADKEGRSVWSVDYKPDPARKGSVTLIVTGRYFPSRKIFFVDWFNAAMTVAEGTYRWRPNVKLGGIARSGP